MQIRPIEARDYPAVVALSRPIVHAGETYALPRDMDDGGLLDYWVAPDKVTFVCELDGVVEGVGYLRSNQLGGGDHVANAAFMTAVASRGKGVASALCAYAIDDARARGYRGMQFNFVVSTNTRAIALWQRHGFAILARLPDAFRHPEHGFVDALVMHRSLLP